MTSTHIDATGYTFIKITGASSAATINGIAGGTQGKIVYLLLDGLYTLTFNSSSETCSTCKIIKTYSASSSYNGTKYVVALVYDVSFWQVISYML